MFGCDFGATLLGILFHAIGTRNTLLIYAGMTSLVLLVFLLYIKFSENVNEYERLPSDKDESIEDQCEVMNNDDGGIKENTHKEF